MIILDLQEYVVFEQHSLPPIQEQTGLITNNPKTLEYKWNSNETKMLIDLYKKYKNKVGTFEIRSAKMLWLKIAEELKKLKIEVTPNNCLNRWRVLERNYKKHIDNQNKTGIFILITAKFVGKNIT